MLNDKQLIRLFDKVTKDEIMRLEAEVKYGAMSDYMYWSQALRKMVNINYQVAYDMVYNMNQEYIKQLNSFTVKDHSTLQRYMMRVFKQNELTPLIGAVEINVAQPIVEEGLFEIYYASSVAGVTEFKKKVNIATTFSPANQYAIDYYKYLTDTRSKFLLDTNRKRLANVLTSSATEGLTLRETKARLIADLKDTKNIAARAHTIATTETSVSLNWAKYEAGKNTRVKMVKTWYTTGNNRVRPSHAILDGVTIPYEEDFITGNGNYAKYPADPDLPSEDVIGCLCTFGQAPA